MDDAVREAAKAARKHVIDSNKAWKAATTVRRDWLATFAQRKTPPTGAEQFLARAVNDAWWPQVGAHELLHTSRETLAPELGTATPKRAVQVAALVLILASWECRV